MSQTIENFGRNVGFETDQYFQPESTDEILKILTEHSGQRFRAIGSLHSWSRAIETDGVIIDMSRMVAISIDPSSPDHPTVTVGGGCQVKHLLKALSEVGLTLPSVGLIDEQTVAGATATGTHGSGKHCLSQYIEAVEIAHFDSDGNAILTHVTEGADLAAARCSLGLLGIVVSITFTCREKYNVNEHATAYKNVSDVLAKEMDFPLQQFYLMPWSWTLFAHHRRETDSHKSRLAWLYRWYCFLVIDLGLHFVVFTLGKLIKSHWLTRCFFKYVVPFTIARKWSVTDDSHNMLVMEHELFRHCEIEIFVQREHVDAATDLLVDIVSVFGGQTMRSESQQASKASLDRIEMLETLNRNRGRYCHHYPICYRRVVADDTLISMASKPKQPLVSGDESSVVGTSDWFAISFITYQWPDDRAGFFEFADFISAVTAELFDGRCHWGKLNPLDREQNLKLYPRMGEFKQVVKKFDSAGRFGNDWFDEVL